MTLPTTTTLNGCDDDSDMFGPPRSSPPIGYRSRVPMISPKLRQREERKRILQLCAHKLERIKDSETNLRRSVCINNTYCRLTDELRREKQSRYLANLPRSESLPETARDNIFNPYNSCGIDSSHHQPSNKNALMNNTCNSNNNNNNNINSNGNSNNSNVSTTLDDIDDHIDVVDDVDDVFHKTAPISYNNNHHNHNNDVQTTNIHDNNNNNSNCNLAICITAASNVHNSCSSSRSDSVNSTTTTTSASNTPTTHLSTTNAHSKQHHTISSNTLDTDLEILDRELNAINAPLLIDPEITQGAEQLEKALLSSTRKRARAEDESDRLVREALSQFYIPPQRFISAIEDCPLDLVSGGNGSVIGTANMRHDWHMGGLGMSAVCNKRAKLEYEVNMNHNNNNHSHSNHNSGIGMGDLELDFDMNTNQKDFEVIMDALRLGTPSPTPTSDSCGQAAMMLSESASVFHNLVVTSLET